MADTDYRPIIGAALISWLMDWWVEDIVLCVVVVSHMLLVEDLTQSLIMIQPILYAYSFNGPPEVRVDVYS